MRLIFLTIILLGLNSCIDDQFWGSSAYNKVLAITVEGQSGNAKILNNSITITVAPHLDPAQIVIMTLDHSRFSISSLAAGDTVDCVTPFPFTVTAENGSIRYYDLIIERSNGEEQIENSNFEEWYQMLGGILGNRPYFQPGESAAATIWATANEGVTTLSVDDTNTTRIDRLDGSYAAKMKTIAAPALVRLAAATIFTGSFDKDAALANPTNPRAAVDFGTPFTSRPKAVTFEYRYTPGNENRDRSGTLLPYSDQADVYLLLEIRSGETVSRLATAWFRDSTNVTDWKDTTIELIYGELPDTAPEWQIPENGLYASSSATPTHLSFVASSSCKGDFFEGAIGSELSLDNIELIY